MNLSPFFRVPMDMGNIHRYASRARFYTSPSEILLIRALRDAFMIFLCFFPARILYIMPVFRGTMQFDLEIENLGEFKYGNCSLEGFYLGTI